MLKRIEKFDFDDNNETVARQPWWTHTGYWVAIVLSVAWVIVALNYFIYAGWWTNRFSLNPAEFVGTVASQLLPLALVWFVVVWLESRGQLRRETDLLRRYMGQLMNPTDEGAVYTKTLTDSLREQTQAFKKVYADVAEQTNAVRADLKQWVKDLATVIEHADTQTVTSAKELAKQIGALAKSTEKANEASRDITESLRARADSLQTTSEKIARLMGSVSGVLTENISRIGQMTQVLSDATQQTESVMTKADGVCDTFRSHSDQLDKVFERYEAQTKQYNKNLFDNAEKILTVLKTQGAYLDDEVEKSVHKLSKAQESIAEQSHALFQLSDDAIRHLNDVGTQFVLQTEVMSQALQDTEGRVEKLTSLGMDKEANNLLAVAQKVEKYFAQLKVDITDVQTEQFMKDARVLLEHLSALSMDIAHIFTPKDEEVLWEKYYAGDNNAFMRHLIVSLPERKRDKVRELFEQTPAVRAAMTRYMAEFDDLISKAKSSEKKSVLLPVLIGSDAGRLYMILKQCLGKKEVVS